MKRLIFTTSDSGARCLRQAGLADAVMPLGDRFFLREPLPSDDEIANAVAEDDWFGGIYRKYIGAPDKRGRLIDLCEPFDAIDLWIDPDPNAQLILVWLLELFRQYGIAVPKLHLVQADFLIGNLSPQQAIERRKPAIEILDEHLELARSAWQAY